MDAHQVPIVINHALGEEAQVSQGGCGKATTDGPLSPLAAVLLTHLLCVTAVGFLSPAFLHTCGHCLLEKETMIIFQNIIY